MTGAGRRAVSFSVRGRVQGVGFRYAAVRRARALGLAGWVRNEADGSVSGFAQGQAAALNQFKEWLGRGPAGCSVMGLAVDEAAFREGLSGFDVEY